MSAQSPGPIVAVVYRKIGVYRGGGAKGTHCKSGLASTLIDPDRSEFS